MKDDFIQALKEATMLVAGAAKDICKSLRAERSPAATNQLSVKEVAEPATFKVPYARKSMATFAAIGQQIE